MRVRASDVASARFPWGWGRDPLRASRGGGANAACQSLWSDSGHLRDGRRRVPGLLGPGLRYAMSDMVRGVDEEDVPMSVVVHSEGRTVGDGPR